MRHRAGAIGSLSSPQGVIRMFNFRGQNMKRLLLAGVAISVAGAASAADMQARPYSKAPPAVVSPAYNWSGFYIGAMGGYGWDSGNSSGGFGGGTVGYNWQLQPGRLVLVSKSTPAAPASRTASRQTSAGAFWPPGNLKTNRSGGVPARAGFD